MINPFQNWLLLFLQYYKMLVVFFHDEIKAHIFAQIG